MSSKFKFNSFITTTPVVVESQACQLPCAFKWHFLVSGPEQSTTLQTRNTRCTSHKSTIQRQDSNHWNALKYQNGWVFQKKHHRITLPSPRCSAQHRDTVSKEAAGREQRELERNIDSCVNMHQQTEKQNVPSSSASCTYGLCFEPSASLARMLNHAFPPGSSFNSWRSMSSWAFAYLPQVPLKVQRDNQDSARLRAGHQERPICKDLGPCVFSMTCFVAQLRGVPHAFGEHLCFGCIWQ